MVVKLLSPIILWSISNRSFVIWNCNKSFVNLINRDSYQETNKTMLSDLPRELAEEVLSRFPVRSLRAVRLTCKKWNTLTKDWTLTTTKNKQRNNEIHQVVLMLDYRVSLFNVNLVYPSIERVGRLISLDDDDRVDISKIFHCDGLLLCIIKDDRSRVVVWNPLTGQTKWLQPRNSFSVKDKYALGYVKNTYSHKVLRFVDYYDHITKHQVREFEIYNFNSNSWKVLDVKPDWYIKFSDRSVSLDGNTYWVAEDKSTPGRVAYFLLCFDFTTERFGPRLPLPLPCDHSYWLQDTVALSSAKENQLAVLCQHVSYKLKIWISSKIEPNAVSWNELFLEVDMRPLTGFQLSFRPCSFFVDEKKKVAVVLDKEKGRFNTAYIIGKKSYFKKVDLGESKFKWTWSLVFSYVPSSVQINQKTA